MSTTKSHDMTVSPRRRFSTVTVAPSIALIRPSASFMSSSSVFSSSVWAVARSVERLTSTRSPTRKSARVRTLSLFRSAPSMKVPESTVKVIRAPNLARMVTCPPSIETMLPLRS